MKASNDGNAVPDLEQFRSYLKLLADLHLNPRLRVKEDSSDIVQQAMLEAYRDFHDFRGRTDAELRSWLKTILTNNLISLTRRYAAQKKNIVLEVSLEEQFEQSSQRLQQQLAADQSSPSMKLLRQERSEQLADALLQLLDDERTAVVLKHFHDWPVVEIAKHLARTNNAVAGLLRRGLKKLREHFNGRGQYSAEVP